MPKSGVKRVDVKQVDQELIERDINQYRVLLANALNRQMQLEKRGAPDWMLKRYDEERLEMIQIIARLNDRLNKIILRKEQDNE